MILISHGFKTKQSPFWLISFSLLLIISSASAQQASQGYSLPPKALMDLADAPPTPSVRLNPSHEWLLIMGRPSYPSIEEVSKPELRLAGLRIDPRTHGPSRYRYYTSLTIQTLKGSKNIPVTGLPENARISDVSFSPDGKRLAFILHEKTGLSLWTADGRKGVAKQLTGPMLNDVYGSAFRWMPDSKSLLCLMVPVFS